MGITKSPTYDLHMHIGGRHSVLYFSIQATEKYSTAMYYHRLQQTITFSGFSFVQPSLMHAVPSGSQICYQCKWRHLVAKFGTNASGAI